MSELTAEAKLRAHGGFGWLLDGRQNWSVSEVIEAMHTIDIAVSTDAVGRWFKEMPHTLSFGGPIGMRATRDDLIAFFASRMLMDSTVETTEIVIPPS
ncbi:MAG TPA: hypothetical protein VH591_20665 [Ktedonobacterales bacterium]